MKNQRKNLVSESSDGKWPDRPGTFPDLMTPIEAAMFLRLDDTSHDPKSACRTLNYWREKGELNATKFAKRIWYLKYELEAFLKLKTESREAYQK